MSMVADVWAGEVTVSDVGEPTTIDVPATAPKYTAVAPVRLVPVTVTEVPPASGPRLGLTLETVGRGTAAADPGVATSAVHAIAATDTRVATRRIRCPTCSSVRIARPFGTDPWLTRTYRFGPKELDQLTGRAPPDRSMAVLARSPRSVKGVATSVRLAPVPTLFQVPTTWPSEMIVGRKTPLPPGTIRDAYSVGKTAALV